MEKILQTRNQIHEHPTYRSMQTSGKIAKLVYAMTHHFASPIVDLEQNKKSTKQMQTMEQHRRIAQDPSSSTKRTANTETIDTD